MIMSDEVRVKNKKKTRPLSGDKSQGVKQLQQRLTLQWRIQRGVQGVRTPP